MDSRSKVIEHVITRYRFPQCRKKVEAVVAEALPDSQIGHRAIYPAGMMHYLQGTTLRQILDVYNYHLHFPGTEGGLSKYGTGWVRSCGFGTKGILDEIQGQAVLNADEMGWRVQGKTLWLWCLTSKDSASYLIEPRRGSGVLKNLFPVCFNGCLLPTSGVLTNQSSALPSRSACPIC